MAVHVIDTIKPKNNLNFPVVEAIDVFVEDYENLADAISHFATDAMIEAINTVLSDKADTSDINTAVSSLQGQIDQIVISASSESVVAPEVAQARVDINGVEHSTLKSRVDAAENVLLKYQQDYTPLYTGTLSSGATQLQNIRLYNGNTYRITNKSSSATASISMSIGTGSDPIPIVSGVVKGETRTVTCTANGYLRLYTNEDNAIVEVINLSDIYCQLTAFKNDTENKLNSTIQIKNVAFEDFTVKDYYLNPTTGATNSNNSYATTDYISITHNGSVLRGSAISNGNYAIYCLYDENKTFISSYSTISADYANYTAALSDKVKYIRFSCRKDSVLTSASITWKLETELQAIKAEMSTLNYSELYGVTDYDLNGYISATTGAFIENNTFVSTDYFDVVHANSEIIGKAKGNGNYAACAFYDGSKQLISLYAPNSDTFVEYSSSIPASAKYIRLSSRSTDTDTFAKIEWKVSTAVETVSAQVEQIEKTVKPTINYYVGVFAQEDEYHYNSLVDCLWDASEHPDTCKIIHVSSGVYDVLEELGGMEHIMQYASPNYDAYSEGVQPWITNCKIIGYGKVILNFKIDDNTPRDNYWLFSCLNVKGNIEIENIEIHSTNCRYSIHDESKHDYPESQHIYKNVRLFQNVGEGMSGGQALGCGFSEHSTVELHDCHMEVGLTTAVAFSCHTSDGDSILFNHSIIMGGNSTYNIRISQVQEVDTYVKFDSTFIDKGLKISEETSRDVDGKTKIDLINTTLPNLVNGYNSNSEAVISYNTLTGIKTVLVEPD